MVNLYISHVRIFFPLHEHVYMIFVDAGMTGDYSNAQILVRNYQGGYTTGIQDANGNYATDQQLATLDATEGLQITFILAWSTRHLQIEAVTPGDTSQPNTGSSSR